MSPRSREEVADLLSEWAEDLDDAHASALIVVEGKRDLSSLRELGVRTPATSLNLGLSMQDLVGAICESKGPFSGMPRPDPVIILTDWDRRGYRLSVSLRDACAHLGMRYDLDFRRRIALIAGRWVKDVESLPALLRNLSGGLSPDVVEHPDGVTPGP
jgi:5S rRNA maturation endonuclease (ribonuclease M5)